MDSSRNQQHLGVNKISKNIRKSPLHHPNFPHQKAVQPPPQQQQQQQQQQAPAPPQPQVYNISKNDFRSVVQQLTGTPTRDPANPNPPSLPPPSRPPHPKPPSMRLQKIRPPPLTPIARPPPPIAHPPHNPNLLPNQSSFHHHHHQRPAAPSPNAPGPAWADSPVSAYMRYLESSLLTSDGFRQPGLLPSPSMPMPMPPPPGMAFPSPRANPPPHLPPGAAFPSPRGNPPPGLLPSPTSQFPLPSPSSFLNLLSPHSPYPLLSPGFQHPPPLTPNFSFSPMTSQSGILGPGPQPPPSPGLLFPASPSGFRPLMSPWWKDL